MKTKKPEKPVTKIDELLNKFRNKTLTEKLREHNETLLNETVVLKAKLKLLVDIDRPYKSLEILPNSKLYSEATAIGVASDWHFEEVVNKETVNNLNEYNLIIAERRAKNFFSNFLKLINISAKDIKINNIILALLGDFITGHIHPELMEGNELSPTRATYTVLNVLKAGIQFLLNELPDVKITIPCSIGNHGRTTEKSRIATAAQNSFEWLMYRLLADFFIDEKRVTFIIEDSYHTYLPVYGYVLRFHHGDWLSYNGGVGGLLIPAGKAVAQWNKNRTAYLDIFAHWHNLMMDTGSHKMVVNGSLIGYSPYAIRIKAGYERAQQAFLLIDKKRGKTITAPILVD